MRRICRRGILLERTVEGNEATKAKGEGRWKIAVRLSIIVFKKIIAIPPTRPKNSCYPYHRRARTSIDARHRHLFPIRRTLSRMVFAKHVYPLRVLCACRAHTRARTHACTVFIDLGPGGNTRFMVSSTTRAGSKFQRGGNSAQITTLWIVYLLVPAFKFSFLFFLFFFLFLCKSKQ